MAMGHGSMLWHSAAHGRRVYWYPGMEERRFQPCATLNETRISKASSRCVQTNCEADTRDRARRCGEGWGTLTFWSFGHQKAPHDWKQKYTLFDVTWSAPFSGHVGNGELCLKRRKKISTFNKSMACACGGVQATG
jgi:hypothetical protein